MPAATPRHARLRLPGIAATAALAVACGGPRPPLPQPAPTAGGSRMAGSAPVQAADRARTIEASGRTGFWLAPASICSHDARAGQTATLSWNVKASGVERVAAYVVDKAGNEVKFRQGGPVDGQETGPWLRPGMTFRLRDADNNALLGSVVLADKSCD